MDKKICTKCKIEKNVDNFCKNKTRKDGLSDWCKDCLAEYRNSRKEEIKAYRENNKDKIYASNNRYKKKNREIQKIISVNILQIIKKRFWKVKGKGEKKDTKQSLYIN